MSLPRLSPAVALLLAAGYFFPAQEARAADRIWSALVYATNENPPAPLPKSLVPYAAGLRTVFGYNSFSLLGEKRKTIWKGTEAWLVPSNKLFLKMTCTDRTRSAYTALLELYHEKRLIVTSEARLAKRAPIYIRGPQVGRGQFIFILEVQ